jgi:uncharacterized damage-inducible protein DinB
MAEVRPEQAVFFCEAVALPWLFQEHQLTKRVIEAIPIANSDYRPHPEARSALELAFHIVSAELRYLEGVADGVFDFSQVHIPQTVRDPGQLAAQYDEAFMATLGKVKGVSPEQLLKVLDYRGLLIFPAVLFLQIALTHTVHHRGQLSTYLRAMGAKVPAIYGESWDSKQQRS